MTMSEEKSKTMFAEMEQSDGGGETNCLRNAFIQTDGGCSLGLHLSRTPWDPYPWVSGVMAGSRAEQAGVCVGDCVLKVNGEDLLGLKIVDIAKLVKQGKHYQSTKPGISLLLWNSGFEKNKLNPQSLSRFASCLQSIAGLLECPVCLEIIRPPSWQCCHGHVICSGCRAKSSKCPICRVVLGRGRCIVADKLFSFLVQTIGHDDEGAKRAAGQKSSNLQQISTRLPLLPRDHRHCKQSTKLKANNSPSASALAAMTHRFTKFVPSAVLPQYCCPSGQPCDKMKNQHEIFIHLQKSHQTSVVQHYAAPGDTLGINFSESCITCIALVLVCSATECVMGENYNGLPCPEPTLGNRTNGIHKTVSLATGSSSLSISRDNIFFLARFRCIEAISQTLYWLWYLGPSDELNRFHVSIVDESGTVRWSGRPVSLLQNCKEVLKSKQFVRMPSGAKGMRVTINVN
ncbi:uncharacterized protein LOC129718421 [Wyeomyia smithii]|uniref:uncharacterized protein LOC129718421 n=1 Tax=Wyeomyia smithii TaxID=174621 RepID=UPI002467BB62|nr:uncharacterized protein LOC129718421 [Wyeomyia smithii]XP_055525168.1 uncharacterized protein LOC129718421 [Wyeomyia smithii]XP_055525169.1 uncharacterized protein LOC129718421 [Wyeomyia smithii]XP_055525170.1 uncharacterized protein LOC129718421 [Wyeomyia smithii]XP_055525171.1 uncharacterized protein LOC129718421 [Wyeomyia smithii]XP_055525172.1 uncharacterized protein LOC129718421 [Wyeomyia smithii]